MVYKKYKIINGKRYGPYFYENKRVGDKVVTSYLGTEDPSKDPKSVGQSSFGNNSRKDKGKKNGWNLFALIFGLLLIGALMFFVYNGFSPTGHAVLDLKPEGFENDLLQGSLSLTIQEGELVPSNSRVIVSTSEGTREFVLSDLIEDKGIIGDYYVKGREVNGRGEGYGLIGSKTEYPDIEFELLVSNSEEEKDSKDSKEEGSGSESGNDIEINKSDETIGNETIVPGNKTIGNETIIIGNETEQNETIDSEAEQSIGQNKTVGNETVEQGSENVEEEKNETIDSEVEIPTEEDQNAEGNAGENEDEVKFIDDVQGAGITGSVVGGNSFKVQGKTNALEDFVYSLSDGQEAGVIKNTIKSSVGEVSSSDLTAVLNDKEIRVSTDFSIESEGFGEDYLGDETKRLEIDLSVLDISSKNGSLRIEILQGEKEIVSAEEDIGFDSKQDTEEQNKTVGNETVNLVNETIVNNTEQNITFVNQTEQNETIESNLSLIKEFKRQRLAVNETLEFDLEEYFVNAESYSFEGSGLEVEIEGNIASLRSEEGFKGAGRGTFKAYSGEDELKGNEFVVLVSSGKVIREKTRGQIKVGEKVKWQEKVVLDVAENVSLDLPSGAEGIKVKKIENGEEREVEFEVKQEEQEVLEGEIEEGERTIGITGRAIGFITGLVSLDVDVESGSETETQKEEKGIVEIEIPTESVEEEVEYIVEYETEAPIATEEITRNGKKVTISADDELNYTDVLSFADISEVYNVGEEDKIKIYWEENQSYVQFDAYDLDGNNKLDYVEWITPHLSNQTFNIILITEAEHLDENRSFIRDVYDEVGRLDGNSTVIPSGDFVRVTFEQNLTEGKDITIYAEASCENSILINGVDVPCDIYEKKMRLDKIRREYE